MASQEKFALKIQPFLPEGERFEAAFPCTTGVHPMKAAWMALIFMPLVLVYLVGVKGRIVIVTSHAIHVCSRSATNPYRPKAMLSHHSLGQRLIPGKRDKPYAEVRFGGEILYVSKHVLGDVARCDQISVQLRESREHAAVTEL